MLRGVMAVLITMLPLAAAAASVPQPPCNLAPQPGYGAPGEAPHGRIWTGDELAREHWQPAGCLRWSGDTRLVVSVAASFRTADDVFARLSDVAAWPSIRYWSVSHQQWRPLVLGVRSLSGAADAGLRQGEERRFVERNENSGETTYVMRVLERSERRMVIAVDNVTPIKVAILTLFETGALQTVTFVERDGSAGGAATWHSYQITRIGAGGSAMALRYTGSFVNRLEAVRRYLAGQPTDREPPLVSR
jgi:hypothetical protein